MLSHAGALLSDETVNEANNGAWRGIVRDTADIKAFTVFNSYAVVDTLVFSTPDVAVPEPSTFHLILGAGIAILLKTRRLSQS